MVGEYYGIRWMPNYLLDNEPLPERGLHSKQSPIADLMPELRDLSKHEHPFPVPYVRQFDTMFITPPYIWKRCCANSGLRGERWWCARCTICARCWICRMPVIINCTGLGAKALFNDAELTPVKGQLTFLLPQPEVEYATLGPGRSLYVSATRWHAAGRDARDGELGPGAGS